MNYFRFLAFLTGSIHVDLKLWATIWNGTWYFIYLLGHVWWTLLAWTIKQNLLRFTTRYSNAAFAINISNLVRPTFLTRPLFINFRLNITIWHFTRNSILWLSQKRRTLLTCSVRSDLRRFFTNSFYAFCFVVDVWYVVRLTTWAWSINIYLRKRITIRYFARFLVLRYYGKRWTLHTRTVWLDRQTLLAGGFDTFLATDVRFEVRIAILTSSIFI